MGTFRLGMLSVALLSGALAVGCANGKKCESAPRAEAGAKVSAPQEATANKTVESCEDMEQGKSPIPQTVAGGVHYGPVFTMSDKDTVAVSKLLADPPAYNGKQVRVSGKVAEVCAAKGCWMTVGDGKSEQSVFIKFVDPPKGRLVPVKAEGHDVVAEGTFKIQQISESFARHLVIDAGGTQAEAEKIVGPQQKLTLATPAVTISGIE